MLTDKHIEQHAGYLIEEFSNRIQLEKLLYENQEFWMMFVEMYKKGYQDCLDDNK